MFVNLTVEYIESLMPTSLFNSYQAWLTNNPEKEGRLTEIIQQTATEFRSAIQANGLPLTDTGETAVPRSCVRSALAIILFEVRNELGIAQTEAENIAAVRADVFLRGIWTGTIPVTADPQSHSPSYQGANQ